MSTISGWLPFKAYHFHGGARSWAAQGRCSICHERTPVWTWVRRTLREGRKDHILRLAYCEECKAKKEER